ncbi:MAG: hypothetical protein HKO56_04450 [Bacteroidia bacterium]|nr:hypothetical protein [Bacteroidia bacterium]NNC84763.1 hypothetical protein [Bacteroidia bacterium]NNM15889.1 hypothetical protein [Bacteroidia bacterium]
MKRTAKLRKTDINNVFLLPKEKTTLDFIADKISTGKNQDLHSFVSKLLELYRHSNDFDPADLQKMRFKRVQSNELVETIRSINKDIGAFIETDEFKNFVRPEANYENIFNKYLHIKDQIAAGKFKSVLNQIDILKQELLECEEYELLLSLYRMVHKYYQQESLNYKIGQMVEEYENVHKMAEINAEHVSTGLKAQQVINEAEHGICNQSEIIALYDELCKLLIKESSTKSKYETLIRIIQISEYLENKKHYLEPYIEYAQMHFEEIINVVPESAKDINVTLAKFLNREPVPVRLGYLNKAIDVARKEDTSDELALFKIIHAEVCCDNYDYEGALKLLDEVDYILSYQNGKSEHNQTQKAIIRSATTRFVIYFHLALTGQRKIEDNVFLELIDIISNAGAERSDIEIKKAELEGYFQFLKQDYDKAKSNFIKVARLGGNQTQPVYGIIDGFFQELLKKSPDANVLQSKIDELKKFNESFYSTLWLKILQESAAVMEAEVF